MEINDEIKEIFKEFNIFPADGICYLLSLFHNHTPTYIPDVLKQKVHISGIVVNKNGNLHWNVPLYKGQETAFDWIKTEYVPLFKEANPDRGGRVREATARIKKLFAKHPDIRKEDVIAATKMYIYNTDSKYIRLPHYFVEKGIGANKTSDLLEWIDKHKTSNTQSTGRSSHTNTIK